MNLSCIIILLFCEANKVFYVYLPVLLKSAFQMSADYRNLPEVLTGMFPIAFAE